MIGRLVIGLLGCAALFLLLEWATAAVDNVSDSLATRLGVLTIRVVSFGRYPRRPLAGSAGIVSALVGAIVLVALGLLILYVAATG